MEAGRSSSIENEVSTVRRGHAGWRPGSWPGPRPEGPVHNGMFDNTAKHTGAHRRWSRSGGSPPIRSPESTTAKPKRAAHGSRAQCCYTRPVKRLRTGMPRRDESCFMNLFTVRNLPYSKTNTFHDFLRRAQSPLFKIQIKLNKNARLCQSPIFVVCIFLTHSFFFPDGHLKDAPSF